VAGPESAWPRSAEFGRFYGCGWRTRLFYCRDCDREGMHRRGAEDAEKGILRKPGKYSASVFPNRFFHRAYGPDIIPNRSITQRRVAQPTCGWVPSGTRSITIRNQSGKNRTLRKPLFRSCSSSGTKTTEVKLLVASQPGPTGRATLRLHLQHSGHLHSQEPLNF